MKMFKNLFKKREYPPMTICKAKVLLFILWLDDNHYEVCEGEFKCIRRKKAQLFTGYNYYTLGELYDCFEEYLKKR